MSSNTNQADQILGAQPAKKAVPRELVQNKLGCKAEMHRWLTSEALVYLPPKKNVPTYLMGDVIDGAKKLK